MQLQSDRVFLRDFHGRDAPAYEAYHADERYSRFYAPEERAPEHARGLVRLFVDSARELPRRDFSMAIVERESGRLIGCCSLRTDGLPPRHADFGVELSPNWWGRGLATEAAGTLLAFGFGKLALSEVRAESVTQNLGVGKLLIRLGFVSHPGRPGSAWLNEQGWTVTNWVLPKAVWTTRGWQRGVQVPE